MNNELTARIEKVEEIFIWSDDNLQVEDLITELLDFDDDLRDALYSMITNSVGTKTSKVKDTHIKRLHIQVQKTIKAYAEDQLEQE